MIKSTSRTGKGLMLKRNRVTPVMKMMEARRRGQMMKI